MIISESVGRRGGVKVSPTFSVFFLFHEVESGNITKRQLGRFLLLQLHLFIVRGDSLLDSGNGISVGISFNGYFEFLKYF